MGFIPKDACWYLADVILEHRIEGEPRNVIHVNTHLIEAGSPDQAYDKALALGQACEQEYLNSVGKLVHVVFRGLRELNVIHEELGDGAELTYEESIGMPEERLRQWITPKEQLGVFTPIQTRKDTPNYMPESVMQMLEAEGFNREAVQDRS